MNKQETINKLIDLGFKDIESVKKDLLKLESVKDILYKANCLVFESSSIDHEKRLALLKEVRKLSSKTKSLFCVAHNLTLSIKVSREIGKNQNLIKDSHEAIELWKKIIDQPLAINGLIFTYIDLGLIFSDYKLHSLALRYIEKGESLISECQDDYAPLTKLYVAYAVVYSRINKYKKSNIYYDKVLDMAQAKNDIRTLIPILVNVAEYLIKIKDFNNAQIKCEKALKLSNKSGDNIYKPYIYHTLGHIYLNNNRYQKSKNYLNKASDSFEKMNIVKMITQNQYYLAEIYYKQKKYDDALPIFRRILIENKKLNNLELDIKILKKISKIHKHNKDDKLFLSVVGKLNKALEKYILNKEKMFSDTNANALKHLSQEFDLSVMKENDLKLKFDIEGKKRQLTTEALISVSEKEFLKKIIDKLSICQLENRIVIQLCKQRMQDTKDWNIFMKLFNDIHPQFNKYIINKCSDVTESELRVCNLIKMGFSSLEIAEILSISKRGIEQHRYRIRKKLNLKIDLTIFIQSL